jgi:hypothetical protein
MLSAHVLWHAFVKYIMILHVVLSSQVLHRRNCSNVLALCNAMSLQHYHVNHACTDGLCVVCVYSVI